MTKPTLVLIDDDPDYLNITGRFLEGKGFETIRKTDPKEALEVLRRVTVTAVLLDLRLINDSDNRDHSGLDVAAKIAELKKPIPVFLLTQFRDHEAARLALATRLRHRPLVVDIILKQDGLEKLIAVLEDTLIPNRVFLAYVREDLRRVKNIYNKLKRAGFNPWMDLGNIPAGTEWRKLIDRELARTDFVVICISEASIQKRGLFQKEIKVALDYAQQKLADDIFLIPLRLEGCVVDNDELARYQWVNYFEKDGFDKLVEALRFGGRSYFYSR